MRVVHTIFCEKDIIYNKQKNKYFLLLFFCNVFVSLQDMTLYKHILAREEYRLKIPGGIMKILFFYFFTYY